MEKNDPYLNDVQNQNLAYRAKLPTPKTVHPNTKQSKSLPPEEDYMEFDDVAYHRTNINLNQERMIQKGKFLLLLNWSKAFMMQTYKICVDILQLSR